MRRQMRKARIFVCVCLSVCVYVCVMLVPQPGIEPEATEVKAPSPNHWTTRELSKASTLDGITEW